MAKLTFKFGLGNRSVFTAEEVLTAVHAAPEYFAAAGNGLSIAGLNIQSLDHVIRFSEGTETIVIMAPELDPIEVPCSYTAQEDDQAVVDEPTE